MQGLGKSQKEQREQTEMWVRLWIMGDTKNTSEVHIFPTKSPIPVKNRVYWINGISRATGVHKETVRKIVTRLVDAGEMWEWPNTKNGRFFQQWYSGYKKDYERIKKSDHRITIKIPRNTRVSRNSRNRIMKYHKLQRNFEKNASELQKKRLSEFQTKYMSEGRKEDIVKFVKYMERISGFKF